MNDNRKKNANDNYEDNFNDDVGRANINHEYFKLVAFVDAVADLETAIAADLAKGKAIYSRKTLQAIGNLVARQKALDKNLDFLRQLGQHTN